MKYRPEWVLLLAGTCLLGTGAWNLLGYAAFQSHPQWFARSVQLPRGTSLRRSTSNVNVSATRRVLGRLEIPRIRMSVLVVEGDDDKSLSLAAGHVPGTAAFGALGNSVVAGHRDTAFRALRKIKAGDRIRMQTAATYDYVVENVRIVEPDDLSVLKSGNESMLTLVTCYPFRYVGDAPKRYIVRAKLLGF